MGGSVYVFSIGDIPVRVSFWYGLLLFYWLQGGNLAQNVTWAVVVTVSVLVHELGHALVARHYKLQPQILLHGMGGLCGHDRAERDLHDFFIIAAGPCAGLVLGSLTWLVDIAASSWLGTPPSPAMSRIVDMSLWVNLVWSVVNLLPIWPLDGGQLFRLGLLRLARPLVAERITHVVAIAMLVLAFTVGSFVSGSQLMMLLVLWIGWANIEALMGHRASGPIRSQSKAAKELLENAKYAFAAGNFAEAARLCHRMRQEPNVPANLLESAWGILGVSTARVGSPREALVFLKRAPIRPDVVEALVECYFALDMDEALDALLASKNFQLLSAERRKEILAIVRPVRGRPPYRKLPDPKGPG